MSKDYKKKTEEHGILEKKYRNLKKGVLDILEEMRKFKRQLTKILDIYEEKMNEIADKYTNNEKNAYLAQIF